MSIVKVKCRACNNSFMVNSDKKEVECQVCGQRMSVDDGINHLKNYDAKVRNLPTDKSELAMLRCTRCNSDFEAYVLDKESQCPSCGTKVNVVEGCKRFKDYISRHDNHIAYIKYKDKQYFDMYRSYSASKELSVFIINELRTASYKGETKCSGYLRYHDDFYLSDKINSLIEPPSKISVNDYELKRHTYIILDDTLYFSKIQADRIIMDVEDILKAEGIQVDIHKEYYNEYEYEYKHVVKTFLSDYYELVKNLKNSGYVLHITAYI